MAQIELRIIASTPDELQDILAGLADGSIEPEITGVSGTTTPEPGKSRRGRPAGARNKPKAGDAAPAAETPPATPPAAPATAETKPPETPPAPPAPAAAPPAPAAPAAPPAAVASPSDPVRTALVAVIDKFGEQGPAKAQSILKDIGGAENITSLDPAKYDAVIAAAQQALNVTTSLLD